MKKIIFLLLISLSVFAQTFAIEKVGVIEATWSEPDKDIYSTCIEGVTYYVIEAGYRSGLAIKEVEIDHPILGKIFQPEKCQVGK